MLANSKKNRNIKSNDVNLISEARSTDFCFKTTCVGMFLCFRPIVHCFQCFVSGPSPFGKQFPVNPPYPLEITAFESPLLLGISIDLPWGGGGGSMDIFWNHTFNNKETKLNGCKAGSKLRVIVSKIQSNYRHHKHYNLMCFPHFTFSSYHALTFSQTATCIKASNPPSGTSRLPEMFCSLTLFCR